MKYLILTTLLLTACGSSNTPPGYQEKAVYFGDSLTAWGTYPSVTSEALDLTAVNYGRPSSLVGDELVLNITRVQNDHPAACFIMFGFNDAHDAATPIAVYKERLKQLVMACSSNAHQVYVGTQPKAKGRPDWVNDAFYAAATRQVVSEVNLSNVKLVDIYVLFDYDPITSLDPDNVHFNAVGNKHLADTWVGSL